MILNLPLFNPPPSSSDATLPSAGGIWSKLTKKSNQDKQQQQAQMALARQRLVTLVCGDMETVRMVCLSAPLLRPPSLLIDPVTIAPKYICSTLKYAL